MTRSKVGARISIKGFTLIELLVVIAIIALLISILLPSLQNARQTANIAACMANLREFGKTAQFYMDDEGKTTQPWHLGELGTLYGATWQSEFVWGGFSAPINHPAYPNGDWFKIPTELRPFNKYIAPGVGSNSNVGGGAGGIIKTYVCPSDRINVAPLVDANLTVIPVEEVPSWQYNGNSFAINWYWPEGPPWNGDSSVYDNAPTGPTPYKFYRAGEKLLAKKLGGVAARFPLFYENHMNAFMYQARPHGMSANGSSLPLMRGSHNRWSSYSMQFFDGHAEHRFVDTRFTDDEGRNTWAEKGTERGF